MTMPPEIKPTLPQSYFIFSNQNEYSWDSMHMADLAVYLHEITRANIWLNGSGEIVLWQVNPKS
jgi:hypothetical protein